MSIKIFIALSTFCEFGDQPLDLLRETDFHYVVNPYRRRLVKSELLELGADCDGVVAGVEPYDDEVLEGMKNLACISRCGVGIDNISLETAKAKGITILNTPKVIIQPVAELTLAMVLDLLRRLSYQTRLLKAGRWEKISGSLLAGKTLGIIGLGNIGKRVAELMMKLDVQVCATDPYADRVWANESGVEIVELDALLARSDIVSLHLSHAGDTPFILNERQFSLMKAGALLINVSRGRFVDEDALYDALKSGRLGGAGLDVFNREPYEGNLRELENVVMTPHVATLTAESRLQMEMESVANIINFFRASAGAEAVHERRGN